VLLLVLLRRERRTREAISRGQARLVAFEQPAVVIAPHRQQPQRGEQFGGFARPEWTGDVIAEVDGYIDATGTNIRDYRFKR
jgi:hypothetical protein